MWSAKNNPSNWARVCGVFLFFLALAPAWAQSSWEWGLDVTGAFPQDELKDSLDDEGIGVDLYSGYHVPRSALVLGVELSFFNYGREYSDGPFFPCCDDDLERVETTNEILMGHLIFRLQPKRGAVRPYVQGMLGVKRFSTHTSFYEDDFDDPFDRYTNLKDSVFSYGLGSGLQITLKEGVGRRGPFGQIMLHLGGRYLLGAEAEYAIADSVEIDGTDVSFEVTESRTDLFQLQLGVNFRF